MKSEYNTRQRQLMLEYIESHSDDLLTAADISAHLKEQGTPVGMSTVYRFLDKLTRENRLVKFFDENSDSASYRALTSACHVHCHFLCSGCGKIFHVDCEHFDDFSSHILSGHNFKIDLSKTVFSGQCESCLKEGAV